MKERPSESIGRLKWGRRAIEGKNGGRAGAFKKNVRWLNDLGGGKMQRQKKMDGGPKATKKLWDPWGRFGEGLLRETNVGKGGRDTPGNNRIK